MRKYLQTDGLIDAVIVDSYKLGRVEAIREEIRAFIEGLLQRVDAEGVNPKIYKFTLSAHEETYEELEKTLTQYGNS